MRIDSKGKYYTKIVSTQTLEVLLYLRSGETIRGHVHVQPGRRLSDELNDEHPFLSITGATISQGDQELYQVSFVAVSRLAVQWVIPVQAIGESSDYLEPDEAPDEPTA